MWEKEISKFTLCLHVTALPALMVLAVVVVGSGDGVMALSMMLVLCTLSAGLLIPGAYFSSPPERKQDRELALQCFTGIFLGLIPATFASAFLQSRVWALPFVIAAAAAIFISLLRGMSIMDKQAA
ncbi:hypothetical protein F4X86_01360 [Candidatus Saccharibacteria bacterium]|nr:hypothetical protein [Candidatus Saccharibacteria bacterium]